MSDLQVAIREAFTTLAPNATWKGIPTGWHALDLWSLGELVQVLRPGLVVVDGMGKGGLALYLGDLLDLNRWGRVQAWEGVDVATARRMPEHRRVQWIPFDLAGDSTVKILHATRDAGLMVLVATSNSAASVLRGLATPGSYLIQPLDTPVTGLFDEDHSRDPLGMSAHRWLARRVE